jgi:hypothetical protein
LALELGFRAGDLGWANVYLAELAPLAGPGLVDGAVLESVGVGSSRSPLQAASDSRSDKCGDRSPNTSGFLLGRARS